jgi:hypothetical protein
MNTVGLTKINQLLQKQPSGALFFSSWAYENGISYELQRRYRDSRWLMPIATGVMIRTSEKPTLYSALSCLNNQTNKHFYIGALSALELAGYAHYVPMGRQRVVVYCPRGEWFPSWLTKQDFGVDILKISSKKIDNPIGISTMMQGEFEILLSSPERAFMEALDLAPKYYNLTDLYYIMEQLTTLRPNVLQLLLEQNSSIKVKRLFLYMAEKANHEWLGAIDVSKISLGSGKRAIVKNGVYIPKYQMVVSEDLKNYE